MHSIFIGNLNFSVTEEDLHDLLATYGTINGIQLKRKKGYAFIDMENPQERENVIKNLNGTMFQSRELRITPRLGSRKAKAMGARNHAEHLKNRKNNHPRGFDQDKAYRRKKENYGPPRERSDSWSYRDQDRPFREKRNFREDRSTPSDREGNRRPGEWNQEKYSQGKRNFRNGRTDRTGRPSWRHREQGEGYGERPFSGKKSYRTDRPPRDRAQGQERNRDNSRPFSEKRDYRDNSRWNRDTSGRFHKTSNKKETSGEREFKKPKRKAWRNHYTPHS